MKKQEEIRKNKSWIGNVKEVKKIKCSMSTLGHVVEDSGGHWVASIKTPQWPVSEVME